MLRRLNLQAHKAGTTFSLTSTQLRRMKKNPLPKRRPLTEALTLNQQKVTKTELKLLMDGIGTTTPCLNNRNQNQVRELLVRKATSKLWTKMGGMNMGTGARLVAGATKVGQV